MPRHNDSSVPNPVIGFIGVVLILTAILFSLAVVPMLFQPRDALDRRGGIAGAVSILALTVTGVVLLFRYKTPSPILRFFHLVFGGLSILIGLITAPWIAYNFFVERISTTLEPMRVRHLFIPVIFVAFGFVWLRRVFIHTDEKP